MGWRRFKACKWSRCMLMTGIVVILCCIRADKMISEMNIYRVSRNSLVQNPPCIRLLKNCLVENSDTAEGKIERNVSIEIKRSLLNNTTTTVKNDQEAHKNETIVVVGSVPGRNNTNALKNVAVVTTKMHSEKKNKPSSVKRQILNEIYSKNPPVYDDLMKVVMNTREQCSDAAEYNAIIAVHSATYHFKHRATFRWLYGDVAKTHPYRFKLVFFIGLVTNKTLQSLLNKENEDFGDIVQGNYIDAYINMTYKAIMVFNWLDTYCKGIRGLFRVDDDVFMNMHKLYEHWMDVQKRHSKKTLMCVTLKNDRVLRTGKWAVPTSLISQNRYEFMRCPGMFVGITVDLIHEMNIVSRKVPFFWIDDVVMLGIVPDMIGNVYFDPFNNWIAEIKHSERFYNCMKIQGPACYYMAGIANVDNFKTLYQYLSGGMTTVTVKKTK